MHYLNRKFRTFDAHIENGIDEGDLIVGSVIWKRNFEGRVHQKVKANYLASPPLL